MSRKLQVDNVFNAGPVSAVVLVTCVDRKGNANIITLGQYMPISFNPPLVCIGVSPKRYSHDLIAESGEFVINVPSINLEKEAHFCGTNSGRDIDKFAETGLTKIPAKTVKPPLIEECYGHLECKVIQKHVYGDHTLFVSRVLNATVNEDVLTEGKLDPLKAKPIVYRMPAYVYYTITSHK